MEWSVADAHEMMVQNVTYSSQWNMLPSPCILFDAGSTIMDGSEKSLRANILYIFRRNYLVVSIILILSLSRRITSFIYTRITRVIIRNLFYSRNTMPQLSFAARACLCPAAGSVCR